MKKVNDLVSELLSLNFDGVICRISNQCFEGKFDIERITLKDNGGYLESSLEIVTTAGSLIVDLDNFIEKSENRLYKWGYRIVGASTDNKPVDTCYIEIGKKYTRDELIEIEEKELAKEELSKLLSE